MNKQQTDSGDISPEIQRLRKQINEEKDKSLKEILRRELQKLLSQAGHPMISQR